jgi:hypothetical protein
MAGFGSNTLWGGHAVGEAFRAVQRLALDLCRRARTLAAAGPNRRRRGPSIRG